MCTQAHNLHFPYVLGVLLMEFDDRFGLISPYGVIVWILHTIGI